MALDDLDRAILQALVEDGTLSLRKIAERVGSTAPTVSSRLERLGELGVYRGVTADLAWPQFGQFVAIVGPPTRVDALSNRPEVFQLYRSSGNKAHGLALFGSDQELEDFRRAFPDVETHLLLREELVRRPAIPRGAGAVTCHECGKRIEDDAIVFTLEGRRYAVCCRSCEENLRARHAKLTEGA